MSFRSVIHSVRRISPRVASHGSTRFTLRFPSHVGRLALTLCALFTSVALGACHKEKLWHGIPIEPARDLPVFTFAGINGPPLSTAPAKGQITLLFFGYTHCPDVCPTTLSDWVRVRNALGKDAKRVRFLFVTVDPERDTPTVARQYLAQFDSSFVGLSGDSATTAGIQKAFGVASEKEVVANPANGYGMGHSANCYVLDERGRMVLMYSYGAGWDAMTADIRQLLD